MIRAKHETNFSHGQIRAFLTSSRHVLRSYYRGCLKATAIFFGQKYAQIMKDYDENSKFIKKNV